MVADLGTGDQSETSRIQTRVQTRTGGNPMIFITNYKFKSHMSDDELSQLLAAFMEHGEPGETIGHYQAADRSYGVDISEVEDLAEV